MYVTKKVVALLLSALLLITSLPVIAVADDGPVTITVHFVCDDAEVTVPGDKTVTLTKGDNYTKTEEIDVFPGFAASITSRTGTYNSGDVTLSDDLKNLNFSLQGIQTDVTVTVKYNPIAVSYTVFHLQESPLGGSYVLAETESLANVLTHTTPVITAKEYTGFTAQPFTALKAAADGSTVVNIYYDRNFYLLRFDQQGGFGTEPIWGRYGSSVGTITTPTKPGYAFAGWTPVVPSTIPHANETYTANWTPAEVNYTVAYWRQNADDDGYTFYWAETKKAMADSTVNGVARPGGFPDTVGDYYNTNTYFTFGHADQNVAVNADGSTIVNVFYDREVYTIEFKIGNPGEPVHYEAQTVYHEAETEIIVHPAVYTEDTRTFTAKVTGLATSNTTQDTSKNIYKSLKTTGDHKGALWTPLYTKSADCRNYVIYNSNAVIYGRCPNYGGTGDYKGEVRNPWSEYTTWVPLYENSEVTINKDAIITENGIPRINDDKCIVLLNKGSGDMLLGVPVSVVFEGDTYTGYVTKEYIKNSIEAHGDAPQLIEAESTEIKIVKEPYTENVPEHDEYPNAQYYTRYANDLVSVSNGTAAPAITIGDTTYYDRYEFSARFGQDITDLWPQHNTVTPVVDGLNFKCVYSSQNTITETITDQWELNSTLLNRYHVGNPDYITTYYVTYSDATYETTLRYIDLSRNEIIDEQTCMFNDYNATLNHRNFAGYAFIGGTGESYSSYKDRFDVPHHQNDQHDNDGHTYIFYYWRQEYDITYNNESEAVFTLKAAYLDKIGKIENTENEFYTDTHVTSYAGTSYPGGVPYNFTPKYPSNLPVGVFTFDGWYTDPYFTEGSKFIFDENTTMPANGIQLFAKWVPKQLDVTVLDNEGGNQIGDTQTVDYNTLAQSVQTPPRTGVVFVGWFYVGLDGREKPFDFAQTPILHDTEVYAKWKTTTPVEYTIKYVLEDDHDVKVADDFVGRSVYNVTVYAKGRDQLYDDYKNAVPGYYPTLASHSMNITADSAEVVYTFYYKAEDSVNYTVRYVNKDTGLDIADPKYGSTNAASVTETAKVIEGFVVDEDEKTLTLSNVDDDNVLIFYYTKAVDKAKVTVNHYLVNGANTTLYDSSSTIEEVDSSFTANALNPIPLGYFLDSVKVNGELVTLAASVTRTVADGGLIIDFYYMSEVFYVVHSSDNSKETLSIKDYPDGFDVTERVKTGYLYGGLATDDTWTIPVDFFDTFADDDSLSAMELYPVNGTTYYLREVSEEYLKPRTLFIWGVESKNPLKYGTITYLVTALDQQGVENNFYTGYGFSMDVEEDYPFGETLECTGAPAESQGDYGDNPLAYKNIVVTYDDKDDTVYTVNMIFNKLSDDDYFGVHILDEDYAAEGYDFMPYYVTADGLCVSGVTNRNVFALDPSMTSPFYYDNMPHDSYVELYESGYMTMMMMPSLAMAPVFAIPPLTFNTHVVITMVDGEIVTEETVECGDNIGKLVPAAKDGFRFAGWYADPAFTTPADLGNVQTAMTVYARYIPDDYLKVAAKNTVTKKVVTKITALSAIEKALSKTDYQQAGFVYTINGQLTIVEAETSYETYCGTKTRKLFTSVSAEAEVISLEINVKGLAAGSTVTITPFYITADGTEVYGETMNLVYNVSSVSVVR